jgi:hypothetical protein
VAPLPQPKAMPVKIKATITKLKMRFIDLSTKKTAHSF